MVVNVLCCEAELFVEHFVGSGEAEAVEAPDCAARICSDEEALQVDGQAGCEAEDFCPFWHYVLLVSDRLLAEEAFAGDIYDANFVAVLTKEACSCNEGADFGTCGNQNHVWILVASCHDVAALASLLVVVAFRQILDVLAAEDEGCGRICVFHRHCPSRSGLLGVGWPEDEH